MVDDRLNQKMKQSQHSVGLVFAAEDAEKHLHPDAFDQNGNPRKNVALYDTEYTVMRGKDSYTVHDRLKWLIYKVKAQNASDVQQSIDSTRATKQTSLGTSWPVKNRERSSSFSCH